MVNFGNNSINLTSIYQGKNSISKVYYRSNLLFPDKIGPTKINEYLEQYNWLQSDGSKYSVSYKPVGKGTYPSSSATMKAVIKVNSLDSTINSTTSVFGSSGVYDSARYRQLNLVLKRLDNSTFSVGYFSCSPKDSALDSNNFVGVFNIGDTLTIEANEQTIIINGITYNIPNSSIQSMNLVNFHVCWSGSSVGDKRYSAQIAKIEYISNKVTYSDLVPAKVVEELPIELSFDGQVKEVGTVGMWDKITNKFLTSSTTNNWTVFN